MEIENNLCILCSEIGAYDIIEHKLSLDDIVLEISEALSVFGIFKIEANCPKLLCSNCTQELGLAYQFYMKVKKSEEKFQLEEELNNCQSPKIIPKNEIIYDSTNQDEEEGEEDLDMCFNEYIVTDMNVESKIETNIKKKTKSNKRIPNFQLTNNVTSIINKVKSPDKKLLKRKSDNNTVNDSPIKKSNQNTNCYVPQFIIESTNSDQTAEDDIYDDQQTSTTDIYPKTSALRRVHLDLQAVGIENDQFDIYTNLSKKEDSSVMFKCKYCPKAFASPYYLGLHTRKTHICQYCLKCFIKISDLHKHIKTDHNTFQCSLCPVKHSFTNNSNLRAHLRKVHGVQLPAHVSLINIAGDNFYSETN